MAADEQCSLIEAIENANDGGASMPPHTDCAAGNPSGAILELGGGTYPLTARHDAALGDTGLPSITSSILIEGSGAKIERDAGAPSFRLFHVAADGQLELRNLWLAGGLARGGTGGGGGAGLGGAIANEGILIATRTTFSENVAQGGNGGGVNFGGGRRGGGGLGGSGGGGGNGSASGGGGGGGFGGNGGGGTSSNGAPGGGGGGGGDQLGGSGGNGSGSSGGAGGSDNGGPGGSSPNGGGPGGLGGGGGGSSGFFDSGGPGGFGGGGLDGRLRERRHDRLDASEAAAVTERPRRRCAEAPLSASRSRDSPIAKEP
ncbi:MAG TPA: hypothetical protein VMT85_04875 [Thermoanaerobaculia bacterium]|nr:hypothetical protein [Thermoanaerobaculia bacterium]